MPEDVPFPPALVAVRPNCPFLAVEVPLPWVVVVAPYLVEV